MLYLGNPVFTRFFKNKHLSHICVFKKMSEEKGSGLLVAIGSLALISASFMLIHTKSSNAFKNARYDEQLQLIEVIKRSVKDNLHCGETLGLNLTVSTPSKLACSSYASNRPIRNNVGDVLDFSPFKIVAACANDFLVIKVSEGPEIATRKGEQWSNTKYGQDLFRGTIEFCKSFFDASEAFTWKTGGIYTVNTLLDENDSRFCRWKNQLTGACSCPPGFFKQTEFDFVNRGCGASPPQRPDYYRDEAGGPSDKKPNCGVKQTLCFSWN